MYDIYRAERRNLGETDIIVALSNVPPKKYWGTYVDTVDARTGRDAAGIYFERAHLVFPSSGISTIETGAYCITLKHSSS